MTIASYSELVTELEAWFNRADLTSRIPTFIRLFEARMNRKLRVPNMETSATSITALDTEAVALPTDFRQPRSIYLQTDPITRLDYVTPQYLRSTYAASLTGKPVCFTIQGRDLILAPTPDAEYTLALDYYANIEGLTSSNTTNWLLEAHPDAYLYGSLCMAKAFEVDPERLAQWKVAWDEVMGEIITEGNAARLSGPLQMRATVSE
jgi:hypothetical protein